MGVSASEAELELLTAAATEVCVHMAQLSAADAAARPTRALQHAPARRLARTVVSLGPEQGLAFGTQALHLVEAQLQATRGDLGGLVFWWSNWVHMRALLQAMVGAPAGEGGAPICGMGY